MNVFSAKIGKMDDDQTKVGCVFPIVVVSILHKQISDQVAIGKMHPTLKEFSRSV